MTLYPWTTQDSHTHTPSTAIHITAASRLVARFNYNKSKDEDILRMDLNISAVEVCTDIMECMTTKEIRYSTSHENTYVHNQTWSQSTPVHKRTSERENMCQRNNKNGSREKYIASNLAQETIVMTRPVCISRKLERIQVGLLR